MPGADAARKPQRIALSATAPMLTRRRAQTWMDSKTIRRRKSLLDLPKRQRSIGSRAEASGDRPGSQLADARSIRRPILVSASADPFAPQGARSIDGAWTNVVRSFRSPAACPPGLDGIVHTGCIAANGLAVAVADELSSRSSPCSSIKLLVFRI